MNRKIILLGPYPPPYGGVAIYLSTLFHFLKDHSVQLWTYGEHKVGGPNVRFMKNKRRAIVPLLLREGRGARIADCTHFLIEYPSLLVPIWVVLKRLLRFDWLKIVHDGSLPSRYENFSPLRRRLFRIAIQAVTEFVVVSDEMERWLGDEIGVGKKISVIKSLLPVPRDGEISMPDELDAALGSYTRRRKKVCSIGVFIAEYGFKDVAEAVDRLRFETGDDIGLLLVDGDFARDEHYQAEVLGERDWIVVLKNVAHPLVLEILKRGDAFVRSFALESYGLSRVEAIW